MALASVPGPAESEPRGSCSLQTLNRQVWCAPPEFPSHVNFQAGYTWKKSKALFGDPRALKIYTKNQPEKLHHAVNVA